MFPPSFFESPLARPMLRSALAATGLLGLVALGAGGVRLLPWIVDPSISWPTLGPFARSLAALASEVALVVGWPLGWTLACLRAVERGEWLALQALGERVSTFLARLLPQALAVALAFALLAVTWGRDGDAPGRVVEDLLKESRAACASATEARTFTVPFVDAVWLCAPGHEPRLVAQPPGGLASQVITARGARISADVRRIELVDARATIGSARIHADAVVIEGLVPWGRPSTLPARLRAVIFTVSTLAVAFAAAASALHRPPPGRLAAVLLGSLGPLASLAVLRGLERQGVAYAFFVAVPCVGVLVTVGFSLALSRLPQRGMAAST